MEKFEDMEVPYEIIPKAVKITKRFFSKPSYFLAFREVGREKKVSVLIPPLSSLPPFLQLSSLS